MKIKRVKNTRLNIPIQMLRISQVVNFVYDCRIKITRVIRVHALLILSSEHDFIYIFSLHINMTCLMP